MFMDVLLPNDDYTTGRPYIEAGKFGIQTLSCQEFTFIHTIRSTPKNTPPYKSRPKASRSCSGKAE
jgi:hypothetical protein